MASRFDAPRVLGVAVLISVPLLLAGCEPPPMVLTPGDNSDAFSTAPAGDVVTFGSETPPEGLGPEPVSGIHDATTPAKPVGTPPPVKMETTPSPSGG
jgi:hypothetical protein